MKLGRTITLVPILHGNLFFSQHVRRLCNAHRYDCIAVDLPPTFQDTLPEAVDDLPHISAVVAHSIDDPVYYIPTDPCDAAIEGVRQSRQNRISCCLVGYPQLSEPAPLPPFPDDFAASRLGFDAFTSLCVRAIGNPAPGSAQDLQGEHVAHMLHRLQADYDNILAIVHLRHVTRMLHHFQQEKSYNTTFPAGFPFSVDTAPINPDHLYFALGELPFVAGRFERERQDPFAPPVDVLHAIKDLFVETREEYYDNSQSTFKLSPTRIQIALTFLRNLTVISDQFLPSLLDIVEAAKGVGGNAYALRILKSAKYYPYLPIERSGEYMDVSIDRVVLPHSDRSTHRGVNLLRDTALVWRTLPIRPDPRPEMTKKYRYRWNPRGMCSHVPEDRRIENFNAHLRRKAHHILSEDLVKSEKFSASVKDGIDCRETLRNWHTGSIYVREIPPQRGKVDTVVIVFDHDHDQRYPHCATWYAEHDQESTLTFYGTDPMQHMIGPGIARSFYGGVSLLFPPRPVPNVFELTENLNLRSLAERLVYGALLFSKETNVAYVAAGRPGVRMCTMARSLRKHLVWMPLSSFSTETVHKLRVFHILNGKTVRSWASRFIG